MIKDYYQILSYEIIKEFETEQNPKKIKEKEKAIKDLKAIKKYINSVYSLKSKITENEYVIEGSTYLVWKLEAPLTCPEDFLLISVSVFTFMLHNNIGKNLYIGRDASATLQQEIKGIDSYMQDPKHFDL